MKTLVVINLLPTRPVGYIAFVAVGHVAKIEWILMQSVESGQDS